MAKKRLSPERLTATTFLNVDLDLISDNDLAPLVEALAPDLFALHVGRVGRRYRARLELRGQHRSPNTAISRIANAVRRLPRRQRARWDGATRRDFNIGIQAAHGPQSWECVVEAATVAMVAKARGRIVVTVYGTGCQATHFY